MSASERRFRRLVDEYLDGVIGAEDMEELNRLLESDPGSVDHFVEAAVTHGLLREEAVARLTDTVDRPRAVPLGRQVSGRKERRSATRRAFRTVRRRRLGWLIPFVVAAAVLLFALSLLYRPQRTAPPAVAEATGTGRRYPAERVTSEVPVRAAERGAAETAPVIRTEEAAPVPVSKPIEIVEVSPKAETPVLPALDEELLEIPEWPGLAEKAVEDQAPPEIETSRPVARLAAVDGNVYYKRAGAGRWFKATEGIYFQAGDVLDTWFGKAQVDAGEGCTMVCDRKTVMRFGEGRVRVRRGLLFCRFDAGAERVEVVTDDGSLRHVGTKFVVRVGASGTTVIVGEGSVELGNEEGRVTVGEGHMSRVRKGGPPSQPRKADVAREFAWVQPLLPRDEDEEAFAALSITLINADTDEPMRGYDPIPEGAVIVLSKLPTRNLNIRVNVRPAVVGSVRVDLNHLKGFQINADTGQTQTKKVEEAAPYSLGDGEGDYSPWTPEPGDYTVTATPYSERGARGETGKPVTLRFRVVEK